VADPSARLAASALSPHSAPRRGPGNQRRSDMSKTCGDTARFNRLRKQKIARRQNVRELRAAIDAAKAIKLAKPAA